MRNPLERIARLLVILGVWLLVCRSLAGAGDEQQVRIGLVTDRAVADVEQLLLVRLQQNPRLLFLERTELPKMSAELTLEGFLGQARWEACDVLVLLDRFQPPPISNPGGGPTIPQAPLVVARAISTHSLQVLGYWMVPIPAGDPDGVARILGDAIEPALAVPGADAGRRVVSLSLLRADSPALKSLAPSATCRLAAALQAYPRLSLVERWNVRDPQFEQWLRSTEPAGLRPPDVEIAGALIDVDGRAGVRLQINGRVRSFAPAEGDPSLDAVIARAAAAVAEAERGAVSPSTADEAARFARDAAWFWKWQAFDEAKVSAETAVYLGARDRDTLYVRALAPLFSRSSYVSNLTYARTPTDTVLYDAMRGVEVFLTIPEPAADAPAQERWEYLCYGENALNWAGQVLQGIYFCAGDLPGTQADYAVLRGRVTALAEKLLAYDRSTPAFVGYQWQRLKNVSTRSNLCLPEVVARYGGFFCDDTERLAGLYADAFLAASRMASKAETRIPDQLFRLRRHSAHYPWMTQWFTRPPGDEALARFVSTLVKHERAEVRALACLMPSGYLPVGREGDADIALYARWLVTWLPEEHAFFAENPTRYSFQTLSVLLQSIRDLRSRLEGAFPEAAWAECLRGWLAVAPDERRDEYSGHTVRLLRASLKDAEELAAGRRAEAMPAPAELFRVFKRFTLAPPPLNPAARMVERERRDARIAAFKKEREWYGDPDEGGPIFSMNGAGRRLAVAENVLPAAPGVAVSRLFDGMGLGHAQSVAPAGEGRSWFLFLRVDPDRMSPTVLTALEADVSRRLIVRTLTVEKYPDGQGNRHVDNMVEVDGHLLILNQRQLYDITLATSELTRIDLPRMENVGLWLVDGKVWLGGRPGLLHTYDPASGRLRLVASAMRSPGTNRLDDQDAYDMTRVFAHNGRVHVWMNDEKLFQRNEAGDDWDEVYFTRRHTRSGKPYPLELLWRGVGAGVQMTHRENFLNILVLDHPADGVLQGDYRHFPTPLTMPGGDASTGDRIAAAATQEDLLAVLYRSNDGGTTLGCFNRRTGVSRRVVLDRGSWDLNRVFATNEGFVVTGWAQPFLYVPRQLLDPEHIPVVVQPAPVANVVHPVETVAAVRRFMDRSGRPLNGVVLGFEGEVVKIRRIDGVEFEIPIAQFSDEDQAYLRNQRADDEAR